MAIKDGLISVYLFASGALTTDELGSYTLTNVNGVTSTSTGTKVESSKAVFVDGSDQHFTQAAAATNSLAAGTIAFWLKTDTNSVQYNLFAKNSANFRSQLGGVSPVDEVGFQVDGEGANYTVGAGVTDWTTDAYLMFVWDGSHKYIVVNGVVRQKVVETSTAPASGNFYIGHNSVNGTETLDGTMEQFAMWSQAVSGVVGKSVGDSVTGDAASLYNSGNGLAYANWDAVTTTTNSLFLCGGI